MNKVFKSSFIELFKRFLIILIMVLLLAAAAMAAGYYFFSLEKEILINVLLLSITAAVAVLIAILFSFVSKSSSVVVDDDSVSIIKGNKVYRSFSRSENEFKYNIHRSMGMFVHHHLRVVEIRKNKWKDYRLYLSKKNFEKMLSFINQQPEHEVEVTID